MKIFDCCLIPSFNFRRKYEQTLLQSEVRRQYEQTLLQSEVRRQYEQTLLQSEVRRQYEQTLLQSEVRRQYEQENCSVGCILPAGLLYMLQIPDVINCGGVLR